MISEKKIDRIIKEEISKAEVESIAKNKISSELESKEFSRKVKEITAEVIEDLFKTLWNRSSSWKGGITR